MVRPSATIGRLQMNALRLSAPGTAPALEIVDSPVPGRGEVVVQVMAAGLCSSDLHVIDGPIPRLAGGLPFTLGHETAGRVAAIGDQVTTVEIGDRVAVYGPWGCGHCPRCAAGRDNHCDNRSSLDWMGAGLGRDGGMADAVLVPREDLLVPLRGVDPIDAAPLTDAGLTSYSAIAPMLGELSDDSVVAVIGAGGLGHLAIQILKACSTAQIIAVDVRSEALEVARSCGAHHALPADPRTAADTRAITGGRGVDAVLDFVGSNSSLELAASILRTGGRIVLVGSGGGQLTVQKFGGLPQGATVSMPYWGSRAELQAVIDLAARGLIKAHTRVYALSEATNALQDLRDGKVHGRAVLVPDRPLSHFAEESQFG